MSDRAAHMVSRAALELDAGKALQALLDASGKVSIEKSLEELAQMFAVAVFRLRAAQPAINACAGFDPAAMRAFVVECVRRWKTDSVWCRYCNGGPLGGHAAVCTIAPLLPKPTEGE